ncbi:MAG: TonB-dependent receptor [Prevotellaceae bacterium]|nr:TonB-dependent receptor [Prevotellaceae bacterium]
MQRILVLLLLAFSTMAIMAQGTVKGKIKDKANDEALQFVNVTVTRSGETKMLKGAITDENGSFNIGQLPYGSYTLSVSFLGYKTVTRNFTLSSSKKVESFNALYISEDTQTLDEVTVTGQRSSMKLEVDRKSFDVSQDILNAGGAASDVLENIPSVEVDNDGNISLRGNTSVEVWINGKASGLTSDNRAEILQQLPAESIDRIEVIDNPSAKFSAEGSAGIINIVLKKDRKAGYYGSLQAGGNTNGGANASGNINYNSGKFEGYLNIGYRHRSSTSGSTSNQQYLATNTYENYNSDTDRRGNNLFTRAGITLHATDKDDFTLSGMMMLGGRNEDGLTPYHYGTVGALSDTYMMTRRTTTDDSSNMFYGEFNYRHNFTDKHFLDFTVGFNKWKSDQSNVYQDSTSYNDGSVATAYDYQNRPTEINNRSWEIKLDYENTISENFMIQAGYQANLNHENSPQRSYIDESDWNGTNQIEDEAYFNRFIYDMDIHALYATTTLKFGKFGVMAGLRGEYWKVMTESYDYYQESDPLKRDTPFKKDYFQLFPSVFLSYQITESQQLQLNVTRRLRRPWGGQLNSFKNTSDASIISFGNPELTPEYSNSFSFNYLKTWTQHSLLLSAYYRPTTDVIQRIKYQSSTDGLMYQTNMNVAKSLSTGLEMVLKNKIGKIFDLTTTANAYYYKLDGFSYDIEGQTVTGDASSNFTWNARMQGSLILPYDISVQLTGRYRSRQVVTQGYRKANYSMDLGVRKNFLNKALTLAVNCRDLLNSRKFDIYTSSESFTRHQKNWRNGRTVNVTLTWNFGNMKSKKPKDEGNGNGSDPSGSYNGETEE